MAFKDFKTIVKGTYSTNLMMSKYVKLLSTIFFLADLICFITKKDPCV